jgi:hypothetical protein
MSELDNVPLAVPLAPWGSAGRAPGNPFGGGIQPCYRPPKAQRFIMPEPQHFSYHRRPKRQHRRPINHHPASFRIFLSHRFVSFIDQKSCSKTCSRSSLLFRITSNLTLHRHLGLCEVFLSQLNYLRASPFPIRVRGGKGKLLCNLGHNAPQALRSSRK